MTTTLTGIPEAWRAAVATEMRQVLDERCLPVLDHARYHLGWRGADGSPADLRTGKMIRPALVLLACEVWSGAWQGAVPAAAAVELLHNFSLIHDDIEDGSAERHHRPTVWSVVGAPRAINAGDALFVTARIALGGLRRFGLPAEALVAAWDRFDDASLRLCEGQEQDLSFESRVDVTVDDYLRMSAGKTGALMGLCLELGALVAGAPAAAQAEYRRFGESLGIAFQMRDDLLGVWGNSDATGKAADDLARRKRGLPLAVAMDRLTGDAAAALGGYLRREPWNSTDALRLGDLLVRSGVRTRCEALVADRSAQLQRDFTALGASSPPSPRLDDLAALVAFVTGRDR